MHEWLNKYSYFLICLLLASAICAVYWPVVNHEFVKYDDDTYVTDNRHVQQGLNSQALRWAFTTGHGSNWHPLTWLSHMLDCRLFGLYAGAHHLINVLFHIANTLILFGVLKKMTKMLWPSAFVAAVFALHPLHIESVAWVAERKDVLSTFFWLLTIWAYARYAEKPKVMRYLATLVLFALGLMAKPMLVTIPFVLLLLDYWPLQRLRFGNGDEGRQSVARLLLEKVPFVALSTVSCIVTFIVQQKGGAVPTMEALGLTGRFTNATVSYAAYIGKMFWPVDLAVLYPHPAGGIPMAKVIGCGALLLFLTACFLWLGLRRKYFAVGWLWYVGTLIPVIGIVQVGVQAMADRYTYVPMTGLLIIIAWAAFELAGKSRIAKTVLAILALTVLSACAAATSSQLKYWKDSTTLFSRTLDATRDNFIMHNNYGNLLKEMGNNEEAVKHFEASLRLRPKSPEIHNNIANALMKLDRAADAIDHYRQAIKYKSKFAVVHYNLAVALAAEGSSDEAIAEYRLAIDYKHDYHDAMYNLGFELSKKGQFQEAIDWYKKTIAVKPDHIIAHGQLGLALARLNKIDEAIEQFRIVLAARPEDIEMHCNIAILLERQGQTDQAIKHYRRALEINPTNPQAQNCLNALLSKKKTP